MNASLRRRLYLWLSVSIAVAGLLAAALSFWLSYGDANELQDTQLQQVADVVGHKTLSASAGAFTRATTKTPRRTMSSSCWARPPPIGTRRSTCRCPRPCPKACRPCNRAAWAGACW